VKTANVKSKVLNPLYYRVFLLKNLPLALFAGIKIIKLDEEECITSVSYKWLNKNPFNSMYFAVIQMAAEMSTGAPGILAIASSKVKIRMLLAECETRYYKKVTGRIECKCEDIKAIENAISEAIQTGGNINLKTKSEVTDSNNNLIAEAWFTWSFKLRN
jgi:hypothetical protein